MKKLICCIMLVILLLNNPIISVNAYGESETNNNSTDIVIDRIVSDEEYARVLAQEKNITYEEANLLITQNNNTSRALPETVVKIHRTIYKTVSSTTQGKWKLSCAMYLRVVRNNLTGDYIEILEVLAPYVDMVFNDNPLGATIAGSVDPRIEGMVVEVYFNGSVTYSILDLDISVDVAPGVSVDLPNTMRYSTNTIFRTVI